jgi:hypothetical protein
LTLVSICHLFDAMLGREEDADGETQPCDQPKAYGDPSSCCRPSPSPPLQSFRPPPFPVYRGPSVYACPPLYQGYPPQVTSGYPSSFQPTYSGYPSSYPPSYQQSSFPTYFYR